MRNGCVYVSCAILNDWWPISGGWVHIGTLPERMRPRSTVYGPLSGSGGTGGFTVEPDGRIYVRPHSGATVNNWVFNASFVVP